MTNNNLCTHVVVSERSQFSPSPVEFMLTFMAPTVSCGLHLINVQKAAVVFLKPFCLFGTMCPFKNCEKEITDNPIQKALPYWYILLSGSAWKAILHFITCWENRSTAVARALACNPSFLWLLCCSWEKLRTKKILSSRRGRSGIVLLNRVISSSLETFRFL